MVPFRGPVEPAHKKAWRSQLVMHQFHIGESQPRVCGRPEEEVLVFHEVREFRWVELEDVGTRPALDWHVQHLAGDLVLHAWQGDAIRPLPNCLGKQISEYDLAKIVNNDWLGVGERIASRQDL